MFYRYEKPVKVYVLALYPTEKQKCGGLDFLDSSFRCIGDVYGANVQVVDEPKDFMSLVTLPHVSIELPSPNSIPLAELEHPEEVVYTVGNAKYMAPANVMDVDVIRVHVPVPFKSEPDMNRTLYGFQVLPIIFNDRFIKHANIK